MTIFKECVQCGKTVIIENITPLQFNELKQGNRRHIQDILYNIPKEERELFISGVCGECWGEMFGKK